MGENVRLTAADGHDLGAYRTDPAANAKGGIVTLFLLHRWPMHILHIHDVASCRPTPAQRGRSSDDG